MRTALALVLVVSGALLGPCSSRHDPPPPGARTVSVRTSDGIRLNVVDAGRGPDVVVLSHGATGTKEDLYGLASAFVRDGWRAIAYDARGVGASAGEEDLDARALDLRAVAGYARRTGARTLVLAGGSLGAGLSISMASELDADAIVSLSAPETAFDAIAAARAIGTSVPAFVAAEEGNAPYADDARDLAVAFGVRPVIVSGDRHGTGMFVDHPDLKATIVRFADAAVGHHPAS